MLLLQSSHSFIGSSSSSCLGPPIGSFSSRSIGSAGGLSFVPQRRAVISTVASWLTPSRVLFNLTEKQTNIRIAADQFFGLLFYFAIFIIVPKEEDGFVSCHLNCSGKLVFDIEWDVGFLRTEIYAEKC